jgi:hypothetical protein
MNSPFKFPRRVRIHGGECGAVARALHHAVQKDALIPYEQMSFLSQADLKKAFGSTSNERKQMSTKTSFKRIALVAVSALGFGLLSVAPSSAARANTELTVDALTVTAPTKTVRIGDAASTSTFSFSASAVSAATNDVDITLSLSKPSSSSVTLTDSNGTGAGVAKIASNAGIAGTLTSTTIGDATGTDDLVTIVTAGAIEAATSTVAGTLSITPDVPGTYVVTLTGSTAGTPSTANSITATFTVVARALAYKTGDGAAAAPFDAGAGVAGPANTVTVTAQTMGAVGRRALVTVSGAGATISSGGTVAGDKLSTTIAQVSGAGVSDAADLVVFTPQAGTVTLSIFNETANASGIFSGTASNTVTITVGTSLTGSSVSAALSSGILNAGTATSATVDDEDVTGARTPGATAATIVITLKNAAGGAVSATTATTATITGPGTLEFGGATGRSITILNNAAPGNVLVKGDGTSGIATVTVTAGAFTTTKTVTFYGSTAKYTVTAKNAYLAAGVTDTQIFTVVAVDSAGVVVPGQTVYLTSSSTSTATLATSSLTTPTDSTALSVGATAVAAGKTTITIANASSAPTVTATYELNVVKAGIASVSMAFDKDTYAPGEKATLTITAKNSAGDFVGDAAYANFFHTGGLTSSSALTTAIDAVSITTVSGQKSYTVYMPLNSGTVTVSGLLGASVDAAAQLTSVSASAKVGATPAETAAEAATDAAAEAIDAANAATDAANLAAEAADAATVAAEEARDAADAATAAVEELATQVATLMAALKAQITTLANTVAKIAKKVKA